MELYRRYGPALLRQCERILGNRSDAEDVVQTLFEELFAKSRHDETLPYLYRACTNRCLNLLRDTKRRAALLKLATPSFDVPQTRLDDQIVGLELLGALTSRLDKKSAEILVYRFLDDMGLEEIADLMGISRRAVGARLQKISAHAKKVTLLAARTEGIRP